MADLHAFSSEAFTCDQWINLAIRERPDDEPLESYLATIAMKLHILSQDYTDQLETTMMEAVASMPRVLGDIAKIEDSLKGINTEMDHISQQLKTLDERNVAGIEDLSRLDTIKSNMENCKATLAEHARWSQLVREAKTFLEGGGRLSDSAERIETMQRSLEILQDIPGHDERKQVYESLNKSLIETLRPRVKRDIVGLDSSALQEYKFVYIKLNRESELEDDYVKLRPQTLREQFNKFSLANDRLGDWMKNYLESMTNFIRSEWSTLESLFGSEKSLNIMHEMLCQVMKQNGQTLFDRLKSLKSPEGCLECYDIIDNYLRTTLFGEFFSQVDRSLKVKLSVAFFSGHLAYLDSCYIDDEAKRLDAVFAAAIADINFSSDMGILESTEQSEGALPEDALEAVTSFSEKLVSVSDRVFESFQAVLVRSVTLFNGMKSKFVFRMLSQSMSQFFKLFAVKIDELRIACAMQSYFTNTNDSDSAINTANNASLQTAEYVSRQLEMNGEVNMKSLFTCSLRSIQSVGKLTVLVKNLEAFAGKLMLELLPYIGSGGNSNASAAANSPGPMLLTHFMQSETAFASEFRSFVSQTLNYAQNAASTSSTALSPSSNNSNSIFAVSAGTLQRCKTVAVSFLLDLVTMQPDKVLNDIADDHCWSQAVPHTNDYDESLLPLSSFTQVGEHLLSVVQELETFSTTDSMRDVILLSSDAETFGCMSKGWRTLRSQLGVKEDAVMEALCKRKSCKSHVANVETSMFGSTISAASVGDDNGSNLSSVIAGLQNNVCSIGNDELSVMFVNEWLGIISDSILGLILVQYMKMKTLSAHGVNQLIIDIEYITNVITAMGIRSHPLLAHIYHLLKNKEYNHALHTLEGLQVRSAEIGALRQLDLSLLQAISQGNGK